MMEDRCEERKKNKKRREYMEELKLPCISIIMSYLHLKTCVQKEKPEHLQCVLIALDYSDVVACIVRDYVCLKIEDKEGYEIMQINNDMGASKSIFMRPI